MEKAIYLAGLNPEQEQAVMQTEHPLLVLSGAGTGKTRVLTSRLAHIICSGLAQPWQCLAVTFTNKAAREMESRLTALIGVSAASVWLGTFHKFGCRLLRQHYARLGLSKHFLILDEDDQVRFVKQLMTDLSLDMKRWSPELVLENIQRLKDKGIGPDMPSEGLYKGFVDGQFPRIYEMYQARLHAMDAVDFGDLLLLPLTLLRENEDLLNYYQKQFKYILVDEYQDTNTAQYLLLRLLARGHGNLCCVGDDDQSIYSWRGAEVNNILNFNKDFPDATIIRLERNYRSTAHILGAASGLIAHNVARLGKTLRPAQTTTDLGDKVHVRGYWTDLDEARNIVDEVENCQRRGIPLSNIAVLVRAGFQTRVFEEILMKAGVPYQVIGDYKFYEREEIKDAVAYLRLLLNARDDIAFARVVNKPKRGIGAATLANLRATANAEHCSLFEAVEKTPLKAAADAKLKAFTGSIEHWTKQLETLPLAKVTMGLLEEVGYMQMWRDDSSLQAQGRLENLKELTNGMTGDLSDLSAFLEHISLVTDTDRMQDDNMLSVMTLHASKGLEFDVVFLAGWEEGLFPHSKSLETRETAALEEERRLAYVGITRAKKQAWISFASSRYVFGERQVALPSRFIDELPKEHVDVEAAHGLSSAPRTTYARRTDDDFNQDTEDSWGKTTGMFSVSSNPWKGQRVYHSQFGTGTVVTAEGNKLTIMFDYGGRRKVLAQFVRKIEE